MTESPPDDLSKALNDLDGVVAEAVDEGFPRPTDNAIRDARRLLRPPRGCTDLSVLRFDGYLAGHVFCCA